MSRQGVRKAVIPCPSFLNVSIHPCPIHTSTRNGKEIKTIHRLTGRPRFCRRLACSDTQVKNQTSYHAQVGHSRFQKGRQGAYA